MSDTPKSENPAKTGTTLVKYIMWRTGQYRSIHADGAWANIDHFAKIHLTVFNEHPPVPQYVTQEIGVDGKWVTGSAKFEQIPAAKDVHVVRELEAEIVMSVEAAKVVRDLLTTFIESGEAMRRSAGQALEGTK